VAACWCMQLPSFVAPPAAMEASSEAAPPMEAPAPVEADEVQVVSQPPQAEEVPPSRFTKARVASGTYWQPDAAALTTATRRRGGMRLSSAVRGVGASGRRPGGCASRAVLEGHAYRDRD
jgi:hypothetical protein